MRSSMILLSLALGTSLLSGCGFTGLGSALSNALLQNPDPELVQAGAPSYLLLADALVGAAPEDEERLANAALLYSFYGSSFVVDAARAKVLAGQARAYGERALCASDDLLCDLFEASPEDFAGRLGELDDDDLPVYYAAAVSWLYSIKCNSDDWGALADLPKVEKLLERLLTFDEGYEHGSLHYYLGILKTLRPAALGGDPGGGRAHFLRAIELSKGRDFSFRVDFAANYARAIYDRELHDRILNEVLAENPEQPGLTLLNILAQRRAKQLLASADDYF